MKERLNVSSTYQDLQTYPTLTADLAVEVLKKMIFIVRLSKLCLVDVVGFLNISQLFLL